MGKAGDARYTKREKTFLPSPDFHVLSRENLLVFMSCLMKIPRKGIIRSRCFRCFTSCLVKIRNKTRGSLVSCCDYFFLPRWDKIYSSRKFRDEKFFVSSCITWDTNSVTFDFFLAFDFDALSLKFRMHLQFKWCYFRE